MHFTARKIAEWFVAWAEIQEDAELTNLKIQKLVYYAKLAYMKKTSGVNLFNDRMEAWAHGPVIPDLYHELKQYGRGPVESDEFVSETFNWDDYRSVEDTLVEVWQEYGPYSAWALRNKTHTEAPWIKNFRDDERGLEISDADLKAYVCQ